MKAVEMKVTVDHGISVTLRAGDSPRITIRRPSGDQREPDYIFMCNLNDWVEITEAVRTVIGLVSQANG